MKAVLIRLQDNGQQTLGILQLFSGGAKLYECKTLELPWRDNQQGISCIPPGEYVVKKHVSPKFGRTFYLPNVPGRSEILIHKGNYNRDTLGCILPGINFKDVDGDGLVDVTDSAIAMQHLIDASPTRFILTITR